MKVCLYKNLTLGCWSEVPATASGNRGKGVTHHRAFAMRDCTFVVKGSRQVAIKATYDSTGKRAREVHAWVVGEPCVYSPLFDTMNLLEVTYNPFRRGDFHTRDGRVISKARLVVFGDDGGCYIAE